MELVLWRGGAGTRLFRAEPVGSGVRGQRGRRRQGGIAQPPAGMREIRHPARAIISNIVSISGRCVNFTPARSLQPMLSNTRSAASGASAGTGTVAAGAETTSIAASRTAACACDIEFHRFGPSLDPAVAVEDEPSSSR